MEDSRKEHDTRLEEPSLQRVFIVEIKGLDALKQEGVVPRETVETLEENREWLKDRTDRTR